MNFSGPFLTLSLFFFCFLHIGVNAQTPIALRDTTIDHRDFGSLLLEPKYASNYSDTLFYSIGLNSLVYPYSELAFCENDRSELRLEFTVVGRGKSRKLLQSVGESNREYALTDGRISLEIPFNCDDKTARLDNYAARKFAGDEKLYLYNEEVMVGRFTLDGETHQLYVAPYVGNFFLEFTLDAPISGDRIRPGDVFPLLDGYYTLKDFDFFGRSVAIEEVFDTTLVAFGYKEGKVVPDFSQLKKRMTQEAINQTDMLEENFYLLHFWGEWCLPCVKRIESDKNLFARLNPKKVNIVNVAALMKQGDQEASRKMIEEKQIPHFHLFDWGNALIRPLRIDTYPTYLLLNPRGEVLYRGSLHSPEEIKRLMSRLKAAEILKDG